jgi:hypothetical protein
LVPHFLLLVPQACLLCLWQFYLWIWSGQNDQLDSIDIIHRKARLWVLRPRLIMLAKSQSWPLRPEIINWSLSLKTWDQLTIVSVSGDKKYQYQSKKKLRLVYVESQSRQTNFRHARLWYNSGEAFPLFNCSLMSCPKLCIQPEFLLHDRFRKTILKERKEREERKKVTWPYEPLFLIVNCTLSLSCQGILWNIVQYSIGEGFPGFFII